MSAYEDALRELGFKSGGPEEELTAHLSEQDFGLVAGLARLREEAGFTREDIARAWAVPVAVIEDFERPGSDPALSTVRLYAASIGARYTYTLELDPQIRRDT